MPKPGEVSELDSMISDQGLGLPDKAITDMTSSELILLADEDSVAEQLASQERQETQTPEPTPPAVEPAPTEPTEPTPPSTADDKSNLEQWDALVAEAQGTGEVDELGRLRADRDRLQRELDKRRDSEIENARLQLRGEAADDGRGADTDTSVDYASMVPYFESEFGLDREQASRLVPALGRMIEERTRQVVGTEVGSLRKDLEDTKAESVQAEEQNQEAQRISAGMAQLARLGGTARDLVSQYLQTGSGRLWEYLSSEPSRLATAETVYDAGLALSAVIDTAVSAHELGEGGGSTSIPAEGSNRTELLDETKRGKSWEEKIADSLSESARPFKDTIPFLDKDYLQEGK